MESSVLEIFMNLTPTHLKTIEVHSNSVVLLNHKHPLKVQFLQEFVLCSLIYLAKQLRNKQNIGWYNIQVVVPSFRNIQVKITDTFLIMKIMQANTEN